MPQSSVLARCAAAVCDGGSGTAMGSLEHGLPLVLPPMGGDQPLNAARCQALGVGKSLDAVRVSPADIAEALRAVLREPRYRKAALAMRAEIAQLRGPEHMVELLEGPVVGAGSGP